ncbi:MAG: secondary thiamine-phosphate synthase enzyme YjbQ [Candidatus Micrarchaeota archaeon]|nr:secondary thiamine-phosphate synthase enzyme YjbQ [Candidatus Micrarchaeota archaeon]
MQTFSIKTQSARQIVDVTDQVAALVRSSAKAVLVFCPHTTAAVYVNEFEDQLSQDFLAVAESWREKKWKHDASDGNAAAHLFASHLGASVLVPVENGKMTLGNWQKILLAELDGPRKRTLNVQNL